MIPFTKITLYRCISLPCQLSEQACENVNSPPKLTGKSLKIIVCIKQVPKAQEIQIDPVTQTLKRVGVPSEINPPDRNALEMALQLRAKHGGSITVLTMGPPVFNESLERALAMGIDSAVLLSDRLLGGSDTVPTGIALSEAIHKIGKFDIILCGEETTDSSTGHVGPGIAGHLDIPQITYCIDVQVNNSRVQGKRAVEDGFEIWECPMPCLVTINFGCNKPREPTLLGKIKVKRGGLISQWSASDIDLPAEKIGLKGSPTNVSRVDTVVLPTRGGKIFSGDPKKATRDLIEKMRTDKIPGV